MLVAKRAVAFLIACAIAVLGLSVVSAASANASAGTGRVTPDFAIICSGDVCIQTQSISGAGYADLKAWANTTGFYGHFQLVNTNCGNTIAKSPNETFAAGESHHYLFTNIYIESVCGDNWRVTGWKWISNGVLQNMGAVAFQI
jgi:hypothetical protein